MLEFQPDFERRSSFVDCAPQKVDPALIARFRPAMISCFAPINPTRPPASYERGEAPSGQTIVKPTALGPVANTDTKLLIYGLFQKGRVLAQDGDPLFPEAVRGLLRDSGVKPLRLPANSPNLNAYAERFVLSIRRECLDRFVPLSERHLRTAVTEYVVHYHTERNHQGLGNELITPLPASANDAGPIVSRERLGGILNYYCRAA